MRIFTLCTIAVCLTLWGNWSFAPLHKIGVNIDKIQTKTQSISNYVNKWCKNPYNYCDYRF